MKVLVLNGSPKGKNSNTMILTKYFIDGLNYFADNDVKIIEVNERKIKHCLGCFACWKKPPFLCVINDDMQNILKFMVESELIIWSFPLYHYSVPSKMKALIDRTLPIDPIFSDIRNSRNYYGILDKKIKHITISTCGDINEKSYIPVDKMFSLAYGKENLEHIYFKGGETIGDLEDYEPLEFYLETVKTAGMEYSQFGQFSAITRRILAQNIFNESDFNVQGWLTQN